MPASHLFQPVLKACRVANAALIHLGRVPMLVGDGNSAISLLPQMSRSTFFPFPPHVKPDLFLKGEASPGALEGQIRAGLPPQGAVGCLVWSKPITGSEIPMIRTAV